MGLWWKKIPKVNRPKLEVDQSLTFPAEAGTVSKRWPVLWRYFQVWKVIAVSEYLEGYVVQFESGTARMQYRRYLTTPYIGVRVGPVPVTFYALDLGRHHRAPCVLTDTSYDAGTKDLADLEWFSENLLKGKQYNLLRAELYGEISWI
ncbi:MAG: hypothetical protein R3B69_04410 [Candidatus Paceibacterota bacterium]